jgi:hypothetical protein|tara:strand:- start:895 stop:1512 length:618 start_codon:yes stop_codon:yes gene_type:complete
MARVDNTGGAGYVIDNGTGAAVRTKLNQITAAINSLNSGSGDPSINSAFQPHIDTGSSLFKIRNAANNAYVTIGNISLDNLGHVVAASPTMTGDVTMSSTGFLKVPVGTDAQQPGQSGAPTAAVGQFRYNSDQNRFEGYKNTGWGELGGGAGATGGGTDQVFFESDQAVTTNYTLTANKNAHTVSPTINSGVTVTVPSGAILVIL